MFERTKALFDIASNPQRYARDDEVDLKETANPSEWRDESKPTLREKLASRKRQFITFGFIVLVLVGLVGAYSKTYIPELYGNPVVQEATKWAIVVPVVFVIGLKKMRSKMGQVDRLDLQIPEQGAISYYGTFAEDTTGNAVFRPLKGFSWFGLRGRPVTLGDLSDDFARSFAKQGRSADDPATIRIEDGLYNTTETATGTVVMALTSGLELDEFGRESDLYTALPDLADEEKYNKLSKTMEQVTTENQEYRGRIAQLEEHRDYWKAEAKKTREEITKEIKETHGELAEAGFSPRREPERRQMAAGTPYDYSSYGEDE